MEPLLLGIFNWKTDYLRQLFGICYGEMTQLNEEDLSHLSHYSLVYAEKLNVKLFQMPLISLRRHHELLMMDYHQMH